MKGTANHYCAFISNILGSWLRVGHCMWKAARCRHSPLGTSELLNMALAALLSTQSPIGCCLIDKARVDAV